MEPLDFLVCLAKRLTDLQIPDASRQRVAVDLAPADAACAMDAMYCDEDSVGSPSPPLWLGETARRAGAERADKRQRSIFAAAAPAYDGPLQVDQCGGRSTVHSSNLGLTTPATAAFPDFAREDGGPEQRIPMFRFGMTVGQRSRVPCRPPDRLPQASVPGQSLAGTHRQLASWSIARRAMAWLCPGRTLVRMRNQILGGLGGQ